MFHGVQCLIIFPYARMRDCKIQLLCAYPITHFTEQPEPGGKAPAEPQGIKNQAEHPPRAKRGQPQVFKRRKQIAKDRIYKFRPE